MEVQYPDRPQPPTGEYDFNDASTKPRHNGANLCCLTSAFELGSMLHASTFVSHWSKLACHEWEREEKMKNHLLPIKWR